MDTNSKKEAREVKSLDDPHAGIPDTRKISQLGTKIVALSAEIDALESQRKSYLDSLTLLRERNGIDYNIRGAGWTYEYKNGSLSLKEKLLVEAGVKVSIIARCKRRGKGSWSVRRDREKKGE